MAVSLDEPASSSASTVTGSIDPNNPLYVHPSDSPALMLVPVPFDGMGYRSWRRSIMRSLSVKNKLGFINGDFPKPTANSPQLRLWQRCDDMVTSWILNSLAKDIADSVEYVTDSVELWKELEDRYDQTNGAKLYQIQKEINDLTQGVLDITSYYTKMKRLWEELSNLNANNQCTCTCLCGAKDGTHKAEQDRRLIQFLMGLNEVYTVIRGSVLMMSPLPSMAQAFSILIQEEKQREFKPKGQMLMESVSLNAGSHSTGNYSAGAGPSNSKGFKTNYSAGGSSSMTSTNKSNLFCDHCKRSGHIMAKCYKLHGYPQDTQNQTYGRNGYNNNNEYRNPPRHNQSNNPRFNKGKRVAANVHGSDVFSGNDEYIDKGNQPMSLTREQYGHVMNLLQHFHGGEASSSSNNPTEGAVDLAGPFTEEASGNW